MRSQMRTAVMIVAGGVALASCGGDDNGGSAAPPPTSGTATAGFEAYLQQEVRTASCDTNMPVAIDSTTFVYAADQDTAEPRDLSGVTPGCSP